MKWRLKNSNRPVGGYRRRRGCLVDFYSFLQILNPSKLNGKGWQYFTPYFFNYCLYVMRTCLKVHKRENFLGSGFEICTFS